MRNKLYNYVYDRTTVAECAYKVFSPAMKLLSLKCIVRNWRIAIDLLLRCCCCCCCSCSLYRSFCSCPPTRRTSTTPTYSVCLKLELRRCDVSVSLADLFTTYTVYCRPHGPSRYANVLRSRKSWSITVEQWYRPVKL